MPDTLDDWLEEWPLRGGWHCTRDEVQRLVDEIERLRRERDSLARRCAVRFEETETALTVVRQYAARWHPEFDTGLWWRNDLRTSRPITSAETAVLRRALDDTPEPPDA